MLEIQSVYNSMLAQHCFTSTYVYNICLLLIHVDMYVCLYIQVALLLLRRQILGDLFNRGVKFLFGFTFAQGYSFVRVFSSPNACVCGSVLFVVCELLLCMRARRAQVQTRWRRWCMRKEDCRNDGKLLINAQCETSLVLY